MQKITPHLWFNKNAEEAAQFYVSVFNNGKILNTTHYPEAGQEIHGMEAGTVLTVEFEIEGHRFLALNGGPHFTFNPSISFFVSRNTKEEVDELWEKLSDGGKPLMPLDAYPFSERYGWIQDKYGVSWQIILTKPEGDWRPTIVPSFLFVGALCGKAEEAINFYTSVFENSEIGQVVHYPAGLEPDREGTVMYGDFKLEGEWFAAMDSAHQHDFAFNEAVSLLVTCETQEEIDRLWGQLSAVPEAEQCGWLKDKYGVSWQIVPPGMEKILNDSDTEKANRAMEAMLKMKKLDINALKQAYEG